MLSDQPRSAHDGTTNGTTAGRILDLCARSDSAVPAPPLADGGFGAGQIQWARNFEVANLTALFGIAAWAVTLVLASRIRPVEGAVGGVENLYPLHRRVGVLVAILAATHVVFLTLHSGSDALDLYLPAAGVSIFTGVIAFVLLIGFVVASITRRLSYPVFVLVQRLLGVTFLLGAFHTFAVRGTLASAPGLTIYLGCLTAAGIASLGYRVIGSRLGVGRYDYGVAEVLHLDDDAVEITLVPVGRPLEFSGRAVRVCHLSSERDPARVASLHDHQRTER